MSPLKKLFRFPTVVELGWSETNSLEMREFSPHTKNKTWEDYEAYLQAHYPVRFFLAGTLPKIFNRLIWYKLKHLHYFLVSHLIPSRRYHILDLRQPKYHHDAYRWGWTDADSQMLYANFNILRAYVEKEDPSLLDPDNKFLIPEDGEDFYPVDAEWNAARLEMKRLYFWWMNTRQEKLRISEKMHDEWYKARSNKEVDSTLLKQLTKYDEALEAETAVNLHQLINIRRFLWS